MRRIGWIALISLLVSAGLAGGPAHDASAHSIAATQGLAASRATEAAKDSPLAVLSAWRAQGDQASANFGRSAASAGDVNGDGYDDVIVGAWFYDNGQTDEGRAFVYHGSAAGLSTTPDWTVESDQAGAYFGYSVGTAGDVNGDGYDDIVVGAWGYDNGQTDEGRAFVYHGSAAGLSTTPNWIAESNQDSAWFGYSVGTAGDVNGDGYDDVAVGAVLYDHGQDGEGRAFVYHGSAAGLSTTPNWTAEGNQDFAVFGTSVATAGDANGDGYDDVIVGAYGYSNGQSGEGRAFVYHGSAAGLSVTPDWTAESNQDFADFGWSVSSARDVNGDGYDDVVVGAREYDNGQSGEGRAFVYHGSAAGLSVTPDWTAESNQDFASFGWSVSTARDVNGDGYDDVVVGAIYYDHGQTDEGVAVVYYGSATGLHITPDSIGEPNQFAASFGSSVGSAGDANGDGYDDVVVGANLYDHGQTDEGVAFVFRGRPSS
jgi:FG-GAP repeat protein